MKDPIFEPIAINNLEAKSRIYMSAMHLGMTIDFEVTNQFVNRRRK